MWSILGILSANTAYFVLSATGIGAVLMASYGVFSLIRWIGAAYLVWLGVMAFFGKSRLVDAPADGQRPRSARVCF